MQRATTETLSGTRELEDCLLMLLKLYVKITGKSIPEVTELNKRGRPVPRLPGCVKRLCCPIVRKREAGENTDVAGADGGSLPRLHAR